MRVVVLCLLVCLLSVFPAFAIPVTFDFTFPDSDFSYQDEGLSLQVEAYIDGGDGNDYPAAITQTTTNGLGVSSKDGDDSQFEQVGPDELLAFVFSELVTLQQVTFSLVDAGDEFNLNVDGYSVSAPFEIWSDQATALTDKLCRYDFGLFGTNFVFSLDDSTDKFRFNSMTVDYSPVPTPEPSTWLLFASAITGLFFCHKRRSG